MSGAYLHTIIRVSERFPFCCVGQDLNLRSLAYEANEMTNFSTLRCKYNKPLTFLQGVGILMLSGVGLLLCKYANVIKNPDG